MKKQHDPHKAGRGDLEQVSTINSITHLDTTESPSNHRFESEGMKGLRHISAYLIFTDSFVEVNNGR